MTDQCLDQRASGVPDPDRLVPRAGCKELSRAARRRRLLQASQSGQMRIARCWSESATFYDVLVSEKCRLGLAGAGIPQPSNRVVPTR